MEANPTSTTRICLGCGKGATPAKGQTYRYSGEYWHPSCKLAAQKASQ